MRNVRPVRSIALVGCGKSKLPHAARAEQLYTGALFKAALAHCVENYERTLILSAKHGVLEREDIIAPYDLRLGEFEQWERQEFGFVVCQQLASRFNEEERIRFLVFGGRDYFEPLHWQRWDFPLWSFEEPLAGLGIGQRLAWFKERKAA